MITNNVARVAQRRKIKNASILAQRCQFSTAIAYQLWSDSATRIDYRTLNTLCIVLNCKVSDLLTFKPDREVQKVEQSSNGNQEESIQSYQPLSSQR